MAESREAGFTLIEMVVCLALAALIGLLMVNTIRVAGTASAAAESAATAEAVQSVREHLRRTLSGLALRRVDGTGPTFHGGPDALQAAIAADQALERPVELAVSVSGVPRADGAFDLVESRSLLEPVPGAEPWGRSEVLLAGVAGLAIRYFGAAAEGAQPAWYGVWTSSDRLPRLVEIQIALAPGERRRWPPLLIALGDRR